MRSFHVAIAGATGLVGRTMQQVLDERNFPVGELSLLASANSAGKEILFRGAKHEVRELTDDSFANVDFALFSAGSPVSLRYAPVAAAAGAIAIDNSSAWRMDALTPLVVPSVNGTALRTIAGTLKNRIVAVPNCSTIQLVVALKPLERFGLKRVVVSTYQSPAGGGQRGVDQLNAELRGETPARPKFPHPIAYNTVFHDFPYSDGYTSEEFKMIHETKKILANDALRITATCVRVPVMGGHGESVNVEFDRPCTPDDARAAFADMEGLVVQDDPARDVYPQPVLAAGKDDVFVGRIRQDTSVQFGLNFWIVADNLRVGAATDAVQIAEKLIAMKLV